MKGTTCFILICILTLFLGCNSPLISVDLCVETVPPGASIILNGKVIGKTPKTVEVKSSDSITIRLSGYKEEIIFSKDISSPRTFKFIELRKLHKIYLDYKPFGAKVYDSNDTLIGITPCEIEMTRGEKTLYAKFPHHEEYIDTFIVSGSGMRTEELSPKIKYFPETQCDVATIPEGASVKSLVACDEKLLGEFDEWGLTPVSGTNADIMEVKCDRLFFITHDEKYPIALRFRGSINTKLKLKDKEKIEIPKLPKQSIKNIEFKRGLIESESGEFNAIFENNFFKILSTKYHVPVEIIDLRTNKSENSGANWWDERFFAVRYENEIGIEKFLIYDSFERRRVTFLDFGLFHERDIPGIIRWKEQIPESPTTVKTFYDIRYTSAHNSLFFFLKLFSGVNCWFVIRCDNLINNSQLVDILFE